jgi:hypothetical protein
MKKIATSAYSSGKPSLSLDYGAYGYAYMLDAKELILKAIVGLYESSKS